jgi:hypothetical protein
MRESLENQHIVTALLVDDDGRFVGSIDREAIPPTAEGDEPALDYARRGTPTAAATDPAAEALARMESADARRLIVVEPETGLLQGLVCLTKTGDAFCM